MKKEYKNIHTILDKVKKGELFDEVPPQLYGGIKYYERKEVIKPYLHYLDESAVRRSVDTFIRETSSHYKIQQLAEKFNKKLISPKTLISEMINIYDKLPKEIINDLFNLNYEDITDLKFKDRDESNTFKYEMIERSNNPITKIVTKKNRTKSMIYTRSTIQYYLIMLAMLQQEDKATFDSTMAHLTSGKSLAGKSQLSSSLEISNKAGEGDDKQTLEKHLNHLRKRFSTGISKKIEEEINETAKKNGELLDEIMSYEQLTSIWNDLGSTKDKVALEAANKTNMRYLEGIERELKKVNLNLSSMKNKIKNLLDKSTSYFSSKDKVIFENIFDTDSLAGLEDLELLHPILRKISLEDINIKDIKKMGKIDIYIDASGSMDGGSGVRTDSGYVTKLLFAKAFALKMKEMDMLNEIFSFQDTVKYQGQNKNDILSITGGGGTRTDNVISSIEKYGRNAIVITDAEDSCNSYNNKAFFIGVQGASFNQFNKEYMRLGQAIVFDGDKIHNLNEKGYVI